MLRKINGESALSSIIKGQTINNAKVSEKLRRRKRKRKQAMTHYRRLRDLCRTRQLDIRRVGLQVRRDKVKVEFQKVR